MAARATPRALAAASDEWLEGARAEEAQLRADVGRAVDERCDDADLERPPDETRSPRARLRRLLLRAAAVGVNYAQAQQALRIAHRRALERDERLPKFPLF